MDFVEKLFGALWKTKRQKAFSKQSTAQLTAYERQLSILAQYVVAERQSLSVAASQFSVGVVGHQLLLPEYISVLSCADDNAKLYILLTLQASAASVLGLYDLNRSDSRIRQRIDFLKVMPDVNCYLSSLFPEFLSFKSDVFFELQKKVTNTDADLLTYWSRQMLALESTGNNIVKAQYKKNDILPDWLHATVPCLPIKENLVLQSAQASSGSGKRSFTEKKKHTTEHRKAVSLKEERKRSNPVTHSFEKLETVDEYQGGSRPESGDDDLSSHQKGLDEIEVNQVTVDGETTQSIYQADQTAAFSMQATDEVAELPVVTVYPEWDYTKHSYLNKHCQLHEKNVQPSPNATAERRELVQVTHRAQVQGWRRKINSLVSEPIWQRRQMEGSEIDYDSVIRYLVDQRGGSAVPERLYMQKKPKEHGLAITILFDQSLSSDSWVNNLRVLDVILDSIHICGLLFEDIFEQIMIAGTSSATRSRCDFNIYKNFNSNWSDFYHNSDHIQAKGYTRLGPALRHVRSLMQPLKASKKILILLTDGKPTDLDRYEGRYGVQDIKKACDELEASGIVPFAITIESVDKQHFAEMFRRRILAPAPEKLAEQIFHLFYSILH